MRDSVRPLPLAGLALLLPAVSQRGPAPGAEMNLYADSKSSPLPHPPHPPTLWLIGSVGKLLIQ